MSEIDILSSVTDAVRDRDARRSQGRNPRPSHDILDGNPHMSQRETMLAREGDLADTEDNFFTNNALVPVRCSMIATGSYQNAVRRSFVSNFDDDIIEDLIDTHERSSGVGDGLDILEVSRLSNKALRPGVEIDRQINIANSWMEPRISFILEFKRTHGAGAYTLFTYSGFTDYCGAYEDGTIDEEMRMHFTSCVVTSHSPGREFGRNYRLTRDTAIMVNEIYYSEDNTNAIRRRFRDKTDPEFILSPDSITEFEHAKYAMMTEDHDGGLLTPSHTRLGLSAKTVNRRFNNPAYYVSSIINAMSFSKEHDGYSDDNIDDMGSNVRRTVDYLSTARLKEDPLASFFRDQAFEKTATLTWGDLLEYFPDLNLSEVTTIHFPDGMRIDSGSRRNDLHSRLRHFGQESADADGWTGSNTATMIATSIAQQISSMMVSEMIESIRFSVTNEIISTDVDNRYGWVIGNHSRGYRDNRDALIWFVPMSSEASFRRLRGFQRKFERIILDPWTMDGEIPISIMIDCSIQGDCTIVIEFDGGDEYRFVQPSFADSLTSPIITSSAEHYTGFASDVVGAATRVVENTR